MRHSPVRHDDRPGPRRSGAITLGVTALLLLTGVADASARGGAGAAGVAPVTGRTAGFAPGFRFRNTRGLRSHVGQRARGAYPAGDFGLGYGYGGFGPGFANSEPPAPEPPSRVDSLYTRSVIIHRAPAFGEPGYYARGSVLRIVPEASSRAGVRRYRVDRTDF